MYLSELLFVGQKPAKTVLNKRGNLFVLMIKIRQQFQAWLDPEVRQCYVLSSDSAFFFKSIILTQGLFHPHSIFSRWYFSCEFLRKYWHSMCRHLYSRLEHPKCHRGKPADPDLHYRLINSCGKETPDSSWRSTWTGVTCLSLSQSLQPRWVLSLSRPGPCLPGVLGPWSRLHPSCIIPSRETEMLIAEDEGFWAGRSDRWPLWIPSLS